MDDGGSDDGVTMDVNGSSGMVMLAVMWVTVTVMLLEVRMF